MEKTTKQSRRINPWLLTARILFPVALIATVAFIFSNSMAVAEVSNQASGGVREWLRAVLGRIGLQGAANLLTDHLVRKLAHFAEYMLLGFWLMLCLRVYTRRFIRHISWPVLFGLLTALADETIQLFSEGRSGQISDVWLDFGGMLAGLLCGLFLLCLCRMIHILFQYRDKE